MKTTLDVTRLAGLTPAPSQVWGSVRLVPLIREEIAEDLRIGKRVYQNPVGVSRLSGRPGEAGLAYTAYIPHGLVVSFTHDGSATAAFGTALEDRDGQNIGRCVNVLHRMAKREESGDGSGRLRLLPLHLAMEGFLAQHFGGPDIAWSEYSRVALTDGLSPRSETVVPGACLPDLADALRLFELHAGQCGALVFVADALASAFVVAHPDDYRALHASLIQDFFGALLWQYGRLNYDAPEHRVTLDGAGVETADDLRRALAEARASWAAFEVGMASGLVGRPVDAEVVRRAGPFSLERFMTGVEPGEEAHIGEAIVRRGSQELMYLKTFRLTADQSRRARLLQLLADHQWELSRAGAAIGLSKAAFILELERAELGFLIKLEVRMKARKTVCQDGSGD